MEDIEKFTEFVFRNEDKRIVLLRQKSVIQWIFGDLSFLVLSDKEKKNITQDRKKYKILEDNWGRKILKIRRSDLKLEKQWTNKFGEHICEEICMLFRKEFKSPKTINGYHPDVEDNDTIWEVKTQTFYTTGTAGEKILGSSFKYAEVPSLYKKPLKILCLGGAEKICRESYGNLPGPRCTPQKKKILDCFAEFGIEFVGATDVLRSFIAFDTEEKPKKSLQEYKELKEYVCEEEQDIMGKSKTQPFLKWVGGKTQIIDKVIAKFPQEMKNYHEPFLGGGSVLFAVLSKVKGKSLVISEKIYASDLNSCLIWLYKNIQNNPEEFIQEITKLVKNYTSCKEPKGNRKPKDEEEALSSQESYYYWIRSQFNSLQEEKQSNVGSAMFLFLNKTCFRGVYREGPNGFNVPFGNYKNPGIFNETHIRQISELIQNVVFTSQSFEESLKLAKPGDFLYLDPPYAPEDSKSFVKYTVNGFSKEKHEILFKACRRMTRKDIRFLMSNSEVELVTESFPSPKYKTKVISCRRSINSKNPESKTNEVLITN